jgi:hypothetical protein
MLSLDAPVLMKTLKLRVICLLIWLIVRIDSMSSSHRLAISSSANLYVQLSHVLILLFIYKFNLII